MADDLEVDVGGAVDSMMDDLGELEEKEPQQAGGDDDRPSGDPDFGADPAGADDAGKTAAAPSPAARTAEVPAGTPPAGEDPLPATWKKDVAAAWAAAPAEVRAEVKRREYEIARTVEEMSQSARVGKGVEKLFEPLAPWIATLGVDPWQKTQDLWHMYVNFQRADHDTRLQHIVAFAAEAGLDLSRVGGPAVPDEVMRLQQHVRSLESGIQSVQSRIAQEQHEKLHYEISTFAADTTKRPHFWDVVPEMVELFNARKVATLDQAYELAVRLNPITYAKEVDRLSAEKQLRTSKEAQERAEKARKAARANVRSSFGRGARLPSGSVDQTLSDVYDKIQARE